MTEIFLITLLIFAAAMLYSSVGHGGASGYLAVMVFVLFRTGNNAPDRARFVHLRFFRKK